MACTDVQGIFYRTSAGQIVARMASGFSQNIFTKTKISRDPVDRFWWKAVRFELRVHSFRFWKRELSENFLHKDWGSSRFGHVDRNFRKNALCEDFAEFGRPCRGLKPSRAFACAMKDAACTDVHVILYRYNARANCGEEGQLKSQKFWHKNANISRSCLRIFVKVVQNED